ncbi:putative sterigmatocystin biosynthesis polyketide synthase [Zalerion maritima]|uniref:Sterigmatocystin biosynthesis polyketide synthase n=1 Tax=Zalerion maritima TaxID=339359 RepID=A0AAD5WP83_9PEZI|nr:putative sterigmatocystin biosynthesis polyketide synthase [Zalerion maritima]
MVIKVVDHGYSSRNCGVNLAAPQSVASQVHGCQTGRTGNVDAVAWPTELEAEVNTTRDECDAGTNDEVSVNIYGVLVSTKSLLVTPWYTPMRSDLVEGVVPGTIPAFFMASWVVIKASLWVWSTWRHHGGCDWYGVHGFSAVRYKIGATSSVLRKCPACWVYPLCQFGGQKPKTKGDVDGVDCNG